MYSLCSYILGVCWDLGYTLVLDIKAYVFFTFKTTSLLTGASVYKCYANYRNALGQKKPGKVPENIIYISTLFPKCHLEPFSYGEIGLISRVPLNTQGAFELASYRSAITFILCTK